MNEKKRGILVVSFGTSYEETRKKTIEQIEKDIQAQYSRCRVYRAWTSKMIRQKLLKRDGIHIMDVREALEQMAADGIREAVVQPTHVISGIEYEQMAADVASCSGSFERIAVGMPLLTSREDHDRVLRAVIDAIRPAGEEALVLMGHGTEHQANSVYAALDDRFKEMGYPNIFMGTVEAYPDFESLLQQIKALQPARVLLAPFMIVAGDHACNDLSGEDEDSWKSRFEAAGYPVRCILKGLGEYPGVRRVFVEHVADSWRALEAGGQP